jgi:hypothetical protein
MPIGEHEVDAAELRDTTGDRLGQSVAVADVAALGHDAANRTAWVRP